MRSQAIRTTRVFQAIAIAVVLGLGLPATAAQALVTGPPATGGQASTGVTFAADSYSRVASGGWGTADVGGSYTHAGSSSFSADGSTGLVALPTAGAARAATLEAVSALDVDVVVRVRTSKIATGAGQIGYVVARRHLASNSEYSAQILFASDRSISLRAQRVLNGAGTGFGNWTQIPGLSHSANTWYWFRAQFEGTNPTTIRSRVWPDGQPEPVGWTFVAADSSAALQSSGSVGLRAYNSSSATNAPVTFGFDDYLATPPQSSPPVAPTADFDHAQLPWSRELRFADTSTGGPTSWSWDFGDGQASSSQNATHTYATSGTYLVTLVASNGAGSDEVTRTMTVDPPLAPPGSPLGLTATPGDGQIQLSWQPVAGAAGYRVYRDGVPSVSPQTFTGAGDIAGCGTAGDEATAQLLDNVTGWVWTSGDNVYDNGALNEFRQCYQPSWGRHWARTFPTIGNHEYNTPGAAGYFDYFGAIAGDRDKGYYSFQLGSWLVLVLNSECSYVGGCYAGSAQEQWLRVQLASHTNTCTLAIWHEPLFTSGTSHTPSEYVRPLFKALYEGSADLVLTGHTHNYERFAPQTYLGALDTVRGIRQFVVGTGGESHASMGTPTANSEVRNDDSYGVLKLTLRSAAYDWQWMPQAGKTFTDTGSKACHDSRGAVTTTGPLNGALLGQPSFVDTTALNGTEYRYVVTALDGAGNESIPSAPVWATASSGSPPPPVADFAFSQQQGTLSVNFDDASTNSPTSWNWDFGDGASSTTRNPSHSYAAPGTYGVTLTAGNGGGSNSVTKTVGVQQPSSAAIANDSFTRTVSNGWGSATLGGAYTLDGTATNFSVGAGVGNIVLPSGGTTRATRLNNASARDVKVLFRVRANKLPSTGHQLYVYGEVRGNANSAYRPKLIINSNGSVMVHAGAVVNGSESSIAPAVVVPGLTYSANSWLWLRAEITGASPTTIRLRVWADGQTEPSAWQFTATNSVAVLQTAGAVGVRAYVDSIANWPITVSFDDFVVTTP
ncbi:MAG: PKD domain-containing protein [Chloroflexota bacterium]